MRFLLAVLPLIAVRATGMADPARTTGAVSANISGEEEGVGETASLSGREGELTALLSELDLLHLLPVLQAHKIASVGPLLELDHATMALLMPEINLGARLRLLRRIEDLREKELLRAEVRASLSTRKLSKLASLGARQRRRVPLASQAGADFSSASLRRLNQGLDIAADACTGDYYAQDAFNCEFPGNEGMPHPFATWININPGTSRFEDWVVSESVWSPPHGPSAEVSARVGYYGFGADSEVTLSSALAVHSLQLAIGEGQGRQFFGIHTGGLLRLSGRLSPCVQPVKILQR